MTEAVKKTAPFPVRSNAELGYAQHLEINKPYSELFPNNCAVIERTGDGISVGACTHYLKYGTNFPRHGTVKVHKA